MSDDIQPRKVLLALRAVQMVEDVDTTPVEVPGDLLRGPEPLEERLKQFIRQTLSAGAESLGDDTFEEFDDFEPDDDENELVDLSDLQIRTMLDERVPLDDQEANTPAQRQEGASDANSGSTPGEELEDSTLNLNGTVRTDTSTPEKTK